MYEIFEGDFTSGNSANFRECLQRPTRFSNRRCQGQVVLRILSAGGGFSQDLFVQPEHGQEAGRVTSGSGCLVLIWNRHLRVLRRNRPFLDSFLGRRYHESFFSTPRDSRSVSPTILYRLQFIRHEFHPSVLRSIPVSLTTVCGLGAIFINRY